MQREASVARGSVEGWLKGVGGYSAMCCRTRCCRIRGPPARGRWSETKTSSAEEKEEEAARDGRGDGGGEGGADSSVCTTSLLLLRYCYCYYNTVASVSCLHQLRPGTKCIQQE